MSIDEILSGDSYDTEEEGLLNSGNEFDEDDEDDEDDEFDSLFDCGFGCDFDGNPEGIIIKARVKPEYRELMRNVKAALDVNNRLTQRCWGHGGLLSPLEIMECIGIENKRFNVKHFINKVFRFCEMEEAMVLDAINKADMSGDFREELKKALVNHEVSKELMPRLLDGVQNNGRWLTFIYNEIYDMALHEQKEAMFMEFNLRTDFNKHRHEYKHDYLSTGILMETLCDSVCDVYINSGFLDVTKYEVVQDGDDEKLVIKIVSNSKDEEYQINVLMQDASKVYRIELEAKFEDALGFRGSVLDVYKQYREKFDMEDSEKLAVALKIFGTDKGDVFSAYLHDVFEYDKVYMHAIDRDGRTGLNKRLADKGYQFKDCKDIVNIRNKFRGLVQYISEDMEGTSLKLKFTAQGDSIKNMLASIEQLKNSSKELKCTVDGKERISYKAE